MSEPNRCSKCGTPLPADASAGECSECGTALGNRDSKSGKRRDKKFRIRRFGTIAVLLWLLGAVSLYFCSWPLYESKIPEDRLIVAIGEDGRYLASVESPVKLMKMFSGRVVPRGRLHPRGPIEIWDARGGTVVHRIDCDAVLADSVHVMDQGNIIVATFCEESGSPNEFSSHVYRWSSDKPQPEVKSIPGEIVNCQNDVDGSAIALVKKKTMPFSVP